MPRVEHLVKVAGLLDLDRRAWSDFGLKEVLGDSFLCQNNPLFLAVRKAALALGVTYCSGNSSLSRDYQGFPLLTLDRILEHKVVPYFPNIPVLTDAVERCPDFHLSISLLIGSMNIKKNFLCHESAHCIAAGVLHTFRDRLLSLCASAENATVVSALLGEGFANAVERMTESQASDNTHALFLQFNSYKEYRPHQVSLLRRAIDDFGLCTALQLLTLSYFWRNCLNTGDHLRETPLISLVVFGDNDMPPAAAEMIGACCHLNEDFVALTSSAYFSLKGCDAAFVTFRPDQLLRDITAVHIFRGILQDLSQAVLAPTR